MQPEILINARLPGYDDFDTPEQFIPHQPPARAWETCMTINESWGYNPADTHFKSARQLIHMLCELTIQVPESVIDPFATTIVIDLAPKTDPNP